MNDDKYEGKHKHQEELARIETEHTDKHNESHSIRKNELSPKSIDKLNRAFVLSYYLYRGNRIRPNIKFDELFRMYITKAVSLLGKSLNRKEYIKLKKELDQLVNINSKLFATVIDHIKTGSATKTVLSQVIDFSLVDESAFFLLEA